MYHSRTETVSRRDEQRHHRIRQRTATYCMCVCRRACLVFDTPTFFFVSVYSHSVTCLRVLLVCVCVCVSVSLCQPLPPLFYCIFFTHTHTHTERKQLARFSSCNVARSLATCSLLLFCCFRVGCLRVCVCATTESIYMHTIVSFTVLVFMSLKPDGGKGVHTPLGAWHRRVSRTHPPCQCQNRLWRWQAQVPGMCGGVTAM
uniref:Excreted/secreted protein 22s n=1 Tax=Leishmania major TaxID=5664 RepID=Q1G7I7_LEIMA|nr:excreted/secreted protein 22s [Leishmania major]